MKRIGSRLFVAFLLYTLFIICVEWINLLFTLSAHNLPFGIAEGFSLLFVTLFCFFTKSKWVYEPIKVNKEKVFGILIILIFGFLMSVYPDKAYDTRNYHLIAQNPVFENYFTEDFAYGNFQVWGFRLPDRMFYYFRHFLGYRLGTILNPIILVISFTQLYDVLEWILSKYENCNGFYSKIVCNKLIWSLVILLPLDAILMVGTYYVDIFSLPIILEIVRLLLEDTREQKSIDICYFALLNGICVGFKLTNIVYAAPFVLFYIVKNFNSIKLKDWISAIIAGLSPFSNYLVFNYICTGNPVFPYYNGIFQSPWYVLLNWKDPSWGATTLFEKLFWVVYAVVKPEYRQSEIYDARPAVLMFGILGGLAMLLIFFYSRKQKHAKIPADHSKLLVLIILTLSSTMLWSFTTGYIRYFIAGKLLWGLIAFWFFAFLAGRYIIFGGAISLVCSVVATVCMCLNLQSSVDGRNWSWQALELDSFRQQLQCLLKDRDTVKNYGIEPDLFVITLQEYMGVAELINNNAYVVNTRYPLCFGDIYRTYYEDRISNAETMYDIYNNLFYDVSSYVENLNMNGLYMNDVIPIEVGAGDFYLVDVDKAENADQKNTLWISNEHTLEIPVNTNNKPHSLSFIAGRYYNWAGSAPLFIRIVADETMNELAFVPVDNLTAQKFDVPINVSATQLNVSVCHADGSVVPDSEINQVFIANWLLK